MTSVSGVLLAQAGGTPEPAPLKIPGEYQLLLGAVAVLTLLFVVWAVFIRKRKDDDGLSKWRTRKHHHHHDHDSTRDSSGDGSDGSEHRRRRRRRRREHRPRNPTLAETGGLPPSRPDPPSPSNS